MQLPKIELRLDIGPVVRGNIMLLNEMFSAIGAPKKDLSDIDWIDDLKFFIDNNDDILENYIFPAVRRQESNLNNKDSFQLYLEPLKSCVKKYVTAYDVPDPEDKFTSEKIIELAKKIADEQKKHIDDGDYENN